MPELNTLGDPISDALQQGETPPSEDGSLAVWEAGGTRLGAAPPLPVTVVQSNPEAAGAGAALVPNLVRISQEDYDALDPPEPATLYVIVED